MFVVVREMPEERFSAERRLAREQRLQAQAIPVLAWALGQSGGGEAGGIQIGAGDRLGDDAPRLRDAGPLDDQRHADAALIIRALVGPQRGVARGVVEAAVVRGEDDDGVLLEAEFVQRGQHAAHAFIHALDHRGIRGFALPLGLRDLFILGDHLRLGLQRRVDAVMREVKEERAVALVADELHRFVGQAVRQVLARLAVGQHVPCRALVGGGDGPVAVVGKEVVARRAVAVAGDVHVKAMMLRQRERFAAEVPLADAGRAIAGFAQGLGQREFLQRQGANKPSALQSRLRIPASRGQPVG